MNRTARLMTGLLAIAFLLPLLLPARPASAQGTSGTFPAPISTRQLMQYADRLELSGQQRLALQSIHDDYKREFRVLRDGEIAAFLKDQQSMQGGIPQREPVEDLLENMEHLLAKIKNIDERLFARIQPLLSEDQLAVLPRVRLARERTRYQGLQAAVLMGRGTADLSAIFYELEVPEDVMPALDASMAQYERKLTTKMRKLAEAATHMTLNMMDALAERGFSDLSQEQIMADPELLRNVIAAMQEIFIDLNAESLAMVDDLNKLNEQTYKSVAAALPETTARTFRNAYYRGTYGQLGRVLNVSNEDWAQRATELPDLTDAQRQMLQAMSADYQSKLERLMRDGIGLIEDFQAAFSPYDIDQDMIAQFQSNLAALGEEAGQVQNNEILRLQELFGDDVMDQIRRATAPPASEAGEALAEATPQPQPEEEYIFSGDRFLPSRISRRAVRDYARKLGFDEGTSDVLTALHDDYVEQYNQHSAFEALLEAKGELDRFDPTATSTGATTAEMVQRVYDLRRNCIDAGLAIDAKFFDDAKIVLGKEHEDRIERLRRNRVRQAYAASASSQYTLGRDRSEEGGLDLVAVVAGQELGEDVIERIEPILVDYEHATISALHDRLEAQLDLQQLADRWAREIQEAVAEDVAAAAQLQQQYKQRMSAPTARVKKTNDAIIALNRATLQRLTSELDAIQAAVLRKAYDETAFPTIYTDPASVDRQLGRAMELEDLTADQRRQINELALSYRPEYARCSRRMTELLGEGGASLVGFDVEEFKKWQQREQQMAQLRYDRSELNARAIGVLQALLDPDQIHRIGGLPEPEDAEDFSILRR